MNLEGLFAITAFITAIIYLFLGLLAFQHRASEKAARNWALSPIWSMFPDDYDQTGKKLCVTGKKLFWLSMGFSTLWIILDAVNS